MLMVAPPPGAARRSTTSSAALPSQQPGESVMAEKEGRIGRSPASSQRHRRREARLCTLGGRDAGGVEGRGEAAEAGGGGSG